MAVTAEEFREWMSLAIREALSQGVQAGASGAQQGGSHQGSGGGGGWRRQLDLKAFERLDVYKGGEAEWVEWMWSIKIQLRPMAPMLLDLMGMAEKNVGLSTSQLAAMGDPGDLDSKFSGASQASGELYGVLVSYTGSEARTLVKGVEDLDGVAAWGILHERYSRRTLGRMFRVQRECMYPKQARGMKEVGIMIMEWEGKWRRMMAELGPDIRIPDLWRMSALLEICPKGVKDAIELRLDEIGEDYSKMRAKVMAFVDNRVEGSGGAVPMEIDEVRSGSEEVGSWWGGGVRRWW